MLTLGEYIHRSVISRCEILHARIQMNNGKLCYKTRRLLACERRTQSCADVKIREIEGILTNRKFIGNHLDEGKNDAIQINQ